ncbi:hypothetical protein NHX12_014673 [Muraenolepis orangiensis]|uniref:C3H1-type domain-containing protein n=1 Tax=Muraenolepis orangiensis TaxID=630683 RepID=A0A9Q0DCK9_9TELE|nr:hypothetical protein NHX12_014673 [Muraenolepis orangiensis]
MSKIRRKVTVENTKTISASSSPAPPSATAATSAGTTSRRPSVFERLGPSTGSNAVVDSQCRNWLKTGTCSYGTTCRYTHGPQPRGKAFSFSRSAERPPGDLRERMKNKRQDVDPEKSLEEPSSPTARQRDSSRGRHREKEDIKVTKENTPASEEETAEWEANREDSDVGDYDYELSLEMKRQKIQRELLKLEQENQEKREEIASPERSSSKGSPASRKSSGSPKHSKSSAKASGSGKKDKKASMASPLSESTRSTKGGHDSEKHKEKKEKRRDRSHSSHKAKRSATSEERSGSVTSPVPAPSPLARKKSSSPPPPATKASSRKTPASPPPPRRHSPSPRATRRRSSVSPGYRRDSAAKAGSAATATSVAGSASPPSSASRRSRSPPYASSSSPSHRRGERRHSRGRERSRGGERERSPPAAAATAAAEKQSHGKRDKDLSRDDRDYESEQSSSRDDREQRRDRGRESARDPKDARENRAEAHSLERRDRERDKERDKEREREKEKEREKERTDRKEEPPLPPAAAQEERGYGRGHGGKEEVKAEARGDNRPAEGRAERNGRGRGRTADTAEKAQPESSHDSWESRSGSARERSTERTSGDRGGGSASAATADRGSDRIAERPEREIKGRKRHRGENTPSPRPSPKRTARETSPANSDGYNSAAEEKSERPIGRGQAKLHPQPLLPSPVFPPPASDAPWERARPRWREARRRPPRGWRPLRLSGPREGPAENKKKAKSVRKGQKKAGRKSEEAPGRDATPPALPAAQAPPLAAVVPPPPLLHSPRKGAKKKSGSGGKRSRGGDSDGSGEEDAHLPPGKRRRGPRTPPPSLRLDPPRATGANAEPTPLPKLDANFSDWSDEELLRRGGGPRRGRERERGAIVTAGPAIAPLLPQEPPHLLPTPQPLMSPALLRKPPPDTSRGGLGSLGVSVGNQNRGPSSRRLRSPSGEPASVGREDPQGPRPRRGRLQRKSRIDQLRRGEPSRSTSSDRQDSRSHSSRRSSPDSERQGRSRSRAGSYDSRERGGPGGPNELRPQQAPSQQPPLLSQQPPLLPGVLLQLQQQQHQLQLLPQQQPALLGQPPGLLLQPLAPHQQPWDRDRDWPGAGLPGPHGLPHGRGREPLLMRPAREPLLRDLRDRERLLPEGLIQADYEALLPREAVGVEANKPGNSLHPGVDPREADKTDSVDGEDDAKEDDGQSVVSGGEEYEPISDDELDEILAGSQKKDEQDDDKNTGPLDVIDVDWSSLMPKQKAEARAAGAALLRFTPGAVLLRAGISKRLAGPLLLEQVREVCKAELDDPKDADKLFEHDLGALNLAALNRRAERAGLLSNLGPCCKALCARRDFAIRRQLLKNDKGLTKQMYPVTPAIDNELLQLSMRLFRRSMSTAAPTAATAPEKTDRGAPPAAAIATAAAAAPPPPPLSAPPTPPPAADAKVVATPEVCVS